jgi:DNA-binding CsgD family transcriptional regulator
VESFSSTPTAPGAYGKVFVRDASLMPALAKAWENGRFRPLVLRADEAPFANTAFGREMEKVGATCLVVHGTHDVNGYTASLFTFACRPIASEKTLAYLAQFVVPFLHTAWIRGQVVGSGSEKSLEAAPSGVLTGREREILKWIYLGKSNFEIGAILAISPFTVKNHVRKILRKLDVVNRTQAIGKALELRILNV